jgi:hypothetical protein
MPELPGFALKWARGSGFSVWWARGYNFWQ